LQHAGDSVNRRPLQALQGPVLPLAAAIVVSASASMSGPIKWSKGMPLFATSQSDFHCQYLSRAAKRSAHDATAFRQMNILADRGGL
jgi:hypothetical protein